MSPLPSSGSAERVDDAADERVAHGHLGDAAGGANLAALRDAGVVAEDDGADRVFLEVEGEAEHVVAETRAARTPCSSPRP